MKGIARFFLICAATIIAVSCDEQRVFEENAEFEQAVWKRDAPVSFQFDVADTVSRYNMFVNLRNETNYEFRNIFLFLTLKAPDGQQATDTLECFLADEKGKWYGKGGAQLLDNRILYKRNIRFPAAGTYRVTLEQAMRTAELAHIRNVGFRLEKAGQQ
jgi:gliding motility-associated lipoprotein GldH